MDVDFSLLDIPESTKLNSDSSKHKRTVSKKGSFAHRKRPTRATIRPRSEEIAFVDSTVPGSLVQNEPSSRQIEGDEFRTEEPENSVNPDNSVRRRSEDSRRVPGLLEGLRTSKVLYKGKHTSLEPEPTDTTTTRPVSSATTLPAALAATPSFAELDISGAACLNTSTPVLVLPKSAPEHTQKSEKTGDTVDIGKFSLSARRTDNPEWSEMLGESVAHSQLPSTKVTQQSSPIKNFKSDVAIDTTALPFATSNQTSVARLQYSQGVHTIETSKSVDLQRPMHDSVAFPLTETPSSEVTYKSYPTKFTSNAKSSPENYSKTPPAFKSKEYTHQATNREMRSFRAVTPGPTDPPEQSVSADVDKNTSANSRSKSDSKYWYNQTSDVSVASAKNSTDLNFSLVAVDISNTMDQKRTVDSRLDNMKKLPFDERIRKTPEYVDGNYRQKYEHRNSQLVDNKRTDSDSVFNITGNSESEKINRKHFAESSNSAEVYNHDPGVLTMNTSGEITFVCKLEPSFRGNKSVVNARDNSTNISDDLRESCLPIGILQSKGISTGDVVAATHPTTDRTAAAASLPVSSGRIPREGDISRQEERSDKEGMFTSSFTMQLRARPRHGGNDLSGHGVETRVLPERTFTFSYIPKAGSNTGLDLIRDTSGGQD